MHPTFDPSTTRYNELHAASTLPDRMRVINLPRVESITSATKGRNWIAYLIEGHKPNVKEFVSNIRNKFEMNPDSPRLAAFLFDTFTTGLKDVANEFGTPWYIFSAAGAAFIGSMLHLTALHDEQGVDITEFTNLEDELEIPSLANPIPAKLLPSTAFDKYSLTTLLVHARLLTEARGIVINTFLELDSYALNSLSDGKTPPVYPVGPIVKHIGDGPDPLSDEGNSYRDIMEWLDDQPPWGGFKENQVKEIAFALEHSGHRFLWSLRKPSPNGKMKSPSDYENFQGILPQGFLDRTAKIGKVIGWAPQVEILSHSASVRFGVPIASWPLYAEQQFNAFQMVIEFGLALEIKMDYRIDFYGDNEIIVSSDDISKAIKNVMEQDSEVRRKVKEMSRASERTLVAGGSSFSSLGRLIDDIMENMS
ncbi:anthocyanidin O-glucosyltransferase [Salix suchowensis]|nr:anthocyanidin O-glucosyltransferase [Salix suchowensis]